MRPTMPVADRCAELRERSARLRESAARLVRDSQGERELARKIVARVKHLIEPGPGSPPAG
jgi:hypothetical protein